jgi:protein-tyrosine phosphatase
VSIPSDIVPRYLYLPIDDYENFRIEDFFDSSFEFIEEGRKKGNILIHCHVGVSRSATLAMAYLMRKYNYSLHQIFPMVKRKRAKVYNFTIGR